MFNLAPPPSWVSKAMFRAPGSPECRDGPQGHRANNHNSGEGKPYFEMSSIQPPPVIKVEGTFNND